MTTLYLILKRTAFIASVLFFSLSVNSQNLAPLNANVVIPPPNAAAIARYGEVPVGLYSGKPDISIPLFNVAFNKDFSIPLVLQYDASDIKVQTAASRVGFGWSMNTGGVITRSIVGLPDEHGKGFNYTYNALPLGNGQAIQPYTDSIRYFAIGENDGESDIYTFNLPGGGGRFINTGTGFQTLPLSNYKITISGNAFEITDDNGYKYLFGAVETTQTDIGDSEIFAPTAWYISKILFPNNSDSITFQYTGHVYHNNADYSTTLLQTAPGNTTCQTQFPNQTIIRTQNQIIAGVLLTSITGTQGSLRFAYGNRTDCDDKKIDTIIQLNAWGQEMKRTNLVYDYFNGGYKLKLTGVKEGRLNAVEKQHLFEYYNNIAEGITSKAQDHWGFYNAKNNTTLIPAYINPNGVYIPGANRETDTVQIRSGVLKRIIYPTGGYTQFDFEANDYSSVMVGALPPYMYIPVFNSQSVTVSNSGNSFLEKTITIPYAQSVDVAFRIGNCMEGENATNCTSYSSMPPSTTLYINAPNGQRIYTATTTNSNTNTYGGTTLFLEPGTYTIGGTTPEPFDFGYLNFAYLRYDSTKPIKRWPGGGLRIKRITQHDGINHLNNIVRNYNYDKRTDSTLSNGILLTEPTYDYQMVKYTVERLSPNAFPGCTNACPITSRSTYPKNIPGISAGSYVIYPEAREILSDQSEIDYEFTMPQHFTALRVPPFTSVFNSWEEGLPKRKTYYNAGKAKLREEISVYLYDTVASIPAIKNIKVMPYTTCEADQLLSSGVYGRSQAYFDVYYYKPYRLKYKQDTVKMYENASPLKVITTWKKTLFESIANFNPTQEESDNSTGGTLKTTFAYANNFTGTAVYDSMRARNMLKVPVTIKSYRNNQLTEQLIYNHDLWHTGKSIYLKSISRGYTTLTPETRLLINQYDIKGNALEQQKPDDVKYVYLYGYSNAYPVAKVAGSTYATVSSLVNMAILNNTNGQYTDSQLRTELNKIRTGLPGAQVFTYTYLPSAGITSETDASGKTTFYEYDNFMRLKLIKDQNGYILKQMDYTYYGPITSYP
ncbi:hypothetical protein HNQ91_001991 [Filimonas zeae]|uniref:YD repeat-containing protein n=1 Tax=Filimonas zeae TaxID=1737353 RepID=A0A917MVB6_9BACT|nr:hypothetical protein [Filimonas zeae]MDR6338940.1 hypothetical protein [Filimonas zeae]GGH65860.1 hypothetical protein GCM10011379_19450 [Filimonas zeae]